MSAKKAKRAATPSAPSSPAALAPAAPPAAAASPESVAWIDSPDPRKRRIGQIVLAGVWIYVAALCLLALDQLFHWGIFGPKLPPTP